MQNNEIKESGYSKSKTQKMMKMNVGGKISHDKQVIITESQYLSKEESKPKLRKNSSFSFGSSQKEKPKQLEKQLSNNDLSKKLSPRSLKRRASSGALLNSPDPNLIFLTENEKKSWNKLLLNFQSDIVANCVLLMTRNDLVDVEREQYMESMLNYYSENQSLAQFINYIVTRDVYSKYENPNGMFANFFTNLFTLQGKYLMIELSTKLHKKLSETKGITLEAIEKNQNKKLMEKLKKVIEFVLDSIITSQTIPVVHQFAYYTLYFIYHLKYRKELNKILLKYVFKIPFNSLVKLMVKEYPEDLQMMMTISKVVNALIDNTKTSNFWNKWIHENSADLNAKMMNHINMKCCLCFDKKAVLFISENQSVIKMDCYLKKEWRKLEQYSSQTSFDVIRQHFDPEYNIKTEIISMIKQIQNIKQTHRNQTLTEISAMNMKIKDLKEEKRYLMRLLDIEDDDEDENNENQPKDLSSSMTLSVSCSNFFSPSPSQSPQLNNQNDQTLASSVKFTQSSRSFYGSHNLPITQSYSPTLSSQSFNQSSNESTNTSSPSKPKIPRKRKFSKTLDIRVSDAK